MNDKRPKIQKLLAFPEESRDEVPTALRRGFESFAATRDSESSAAFEKLMDGSRLRLIEFDWGGQRTNSQNGQITSRKIVSDWTVSVKDGVDAAVYFSVRLCL